MVHYPWISLILFCKSVIIPHLFIKISLKGFENWKKCSNFAVQKHTSTYEQSNIKYHFNHSVVLRLRQ